MTAQVPVWVTVASGCTIGCLVARGTMTSRVVVQRGPDREYQDRTFASAGAWLVGRTMHDVVAGVSHRSVRGVAASSVDAMTW